MLSQYLLNVVVNEMSVMNSALPTVYFIFRFSIFLFLGLVVLKLPMLQNGIELFCLYLAKLTAYLLSIVDDHIRREGATILRKTYGYAIEITKECSGLVYVVFVSAAVMAVRTGWLVKIKAILLFSMIIEFLNLMRLASLVYVNVLFETSFFDSYHKQFWPLIFSIFILVAFVCWVYRYYSKLSEFRFHVLKSDNIRLLWVRGVLFFFLAFAAWKLLINSVLLTIIIGFSGVFVNSLYGEIEPRIGYDEALGVWDISTNIFIPARPWENNSYQPNLKLSDTTVISLGGLSGYTQGLPLFWFLILLASSRKAKYFIVGSIFILACSVISISLLATYQIMVTLDGAPLFRLFNAPYIMVPPSAPGWLITIMKPMVDFSRSVAVFVVPAVLAFIFCFSKSMAAPQGDTVLCH